MLFADISADHYKKKKQRLQKGETEDDARDPMKVIRMVMNAHKEELRMWHCENWHDYWIRTDDEPPLTPQELGSQNAQLAASKLEKDRVKRRGADYVLTKYSEFIRCEPDVNGVISTIAAWDNVEIDRICLRDVSVATLAEIVLHYGNDVGFDTLYNVWRAGELVVGRWHARGRRSGASRKEYARL